MHLKMDIDKVNVKMNSASSLLLLVTMAMAKVLMPNTRCQPQTLSTDYQVLSTECWVLMPMRKP